MDVVKHLKTGHLTRQAIEDVLVKCLQDDELENKDGILEESLNLAVSLLLMVPIQCTLSGTSITGKSKLKWERNATLQHLVKDRFARQSVLEETVKLEKLFNARNLERIAGIEVLWTSNLADHLRMRNDDKAVEIFHYASFLKLHQSW